MSLKMLKIWQDVKYHFDDTVVAYITHAWKVIKITYNYLISDEGGLVDLDDSGVDFDGAHANKADATGMIKEF